MGIYIDPVNTGMTKEEWLRQFGTILFPWELSSAIPIGENYMVKVPGELDWNPEKEHLVCLVDNGPFRAAAIIFSYEELIAMRRQDGRVKFWFKVPIEHVNRVMRTPIRYERDLKSRSR